jgi:hypothetical protein
MKTLLFKIKFVSLTIILSVALTSSLFAQDKSEYYQAMGSTLSEMGTVNSNTGYLDLANKFQRIAENQQTEWLPAYYNALCITIYSFGEQVKAKIDPLLDQAQTMVDKAMKINVKESELWVLQGMMYQARIMVDPMTRGQKYSMLANEAFAKAEALNPENPRIYYLQGESLLNIPKAYGGGPEVAKPLFQKAHDKFLTFKPANPLSPNWGKDQNEQLLNKGK